MKVLLLIRFTVILLSGLTKGSAKLKILPIFNEDDESRQKAFAKSDFVKRSKEKSEQHDAVLRTYSDSIQDSYQRAINLLRENFFSKHFDVSPPRHLWEGLMVGLTNVAGGCWQGVAGVYACVSRGWDQGGVTGAVTGSISGALQGTLLALGGVWAGLQQLGAGIGNTPQAWRAPKEGKAWDEGTHEWREYSLDQEHVLVEREAQLVGAGRSDERSRQIRQRSKRKVKDMSYYNLLKVTTDSSPSDIKRAFYKEALQTHPDKNPDSTSSERFQELSKAYQILTNEETRNAYDNQGMCFVKASEQHIPRVDAYTFFAVMFGSYLVEPYVGELRIASLADSFLKLTAADTARFSSEQDENILKQRKRVVDIAVHLRERVSAYVDGKQSEEQFRASVQLEASAIANGDFGDSFLKSIGRTLSLASIKFLADQESILLVHSAVASWEAGRRRLEDALKTSIGTVHFILDNLAAFTTALEKEKESASTTPEGMCSDSLEVRPETLELMKKLEKSIPDALKLAEQVNNSDIHRTLKEVVEKVLLDQAPGATRRLRAKALGILGGEFERMGKETARNDRWTDTQALKRSAERAFVAATAKVEDVVGEESSFENTFM